MMLYTEYESSGPLYLLNMYAILYSENRSIITKITLLTFNV